MVEVENRVERSQPLSLLLEDDFKLVPLAVDLPDLGLKVGVVVERQGLGRLLDVLVLLPPLFVFRLEDLLFFQLDAQSLEVFDHHWIGRNCCLLRQPMPDIFQVRLDLFTINFFS